MVECCLEKEFHQIYLGLYLLLIINVPMDYKLGDGTWACHLMATVGLALTCLKLNERKDKITQEEICGGLPTYSRKMIIYYVINNETL